MRTESVRTIAPFWGGECCGVDVPLKLTSVRLNLLIVWVTINITNTKTGGMVGLFNYFKTVLKMS